MSRPSAYTGASASAAARRCTSRARAPASRWSPKASPSGKTTSPRYRKRTSVVRAKGVPVPQDVYQHTFPNGLTLLAERMEHVRSAALNFLVPAGCVYDPPDQSGLASILAGLITRGAGKYDSRELTLALDNLGLDRSESVGSMHLRFWGATVFRNLPAALELYADILRRPHLPDEEVDPVKALALQDLRALEDEPRSRVLVELRKHHYPAPLSNDHRGTPETIEGLTGEAVRAHHARHFRPRGTILSVAGNI